jgi:hypothetical protein
LGSHRGKSAPDNALYPGHYTNRLTVRRILEYTPERSIDCNSRISRFLINDILRRDGALPAPYIVPLSAVLQRPNLRPLTYDDALELLSRPLIQQYRDRWSYRRKPRGLGNE